MSKSGGILRAEIWPLYFASPEQTTSLLPNPHPQIDGYSLTSFPCSFAKEIASVAKRIELVVTAVLPLVDEGAVSQEGDAKLSFS